MMVEPRFWSLSRSAGLFLVLGDATLLVAL
jgi:hypothetical protein